MKLGLVGQAYMARSSNLNAQRCVNLYPTLDNAGGKNVGALYGTAGLSLFSDTVEGIIRGMIASKDGYLYIVNGGSFYRIATDGTATRIDNIVSNTSPVAIHEGSSQIMIITEDAGYTFDGTTLTLITDPDFTAGGELTMVNGYFVFTVPNTDVFYITAQNDGSQIDPLEFSYANIDGDDLVSVLSVNQELWLFGDKTTEIWAYNANLDFPFDRIQGATIEIGCAAKKSVITIDNGCMWLSKDDRGQGQIVKANGYQPTVVSTPAIDYAISQYSDISDAVAFGYQQDGHLFYQITFPTGNATWVYDVTTNLWHEKASIDEFGNLNKHKSLYHAYFDGKQVVSDPTLNYLYEMDLDVYTDNGTNITRLRSFPHINNEANRMMWNQIQIDMQTGVGLEDGTDPLLQLRWSDDGAHQWSNVHLGSIGKIGEYLKRVIFRRLGTSRDRVFEVRITAPVKIALINAYAKVKMTNN